MSAMNQARLRGLSVRAWIGGMTAASATTLVLAAAPAALADTGCTSSGVSNVTVTCPVGVSDTWTVPAHVTQATFDIQGAAGGDSNTIDGTRGGSSGPGGSGDDVQATVAVAPGQVYAIEVGARGDDGLAPAVGTDSGNGGAPGGGQGTFTCDGGGVCASAGGGGGASLVSLGNLSSANWLLVAGGGGGGGPLNGADGGAGGNPQGAHAADITGADSCTGGAGGSGSTAHGQGGSGGAPGGGGGGGFVGGTGGQQGCGGGGGSGFITPNAVPGSTLEGTARSSGDGSVTITYVLPLAPSASVTSPGDGATYAVGQAVNSRFACADGVNGPGITACTDNQGQASGARIDTSAPGSHQFIVNATSGDGQQTTSTVAYTVAGRPTATIATPSGGATYAVGQSVRTSFTCSEGAGGPGLATCTDQKGQPSGAALDTSTAGVHTLTVTANSADGQQGTATVTYTVVAPGGAAPPRAVVSASGVSLELTRPVACTTSGGTFIVTVATTHSGPGFRLLHYSFFVDRGRAHRVRRMINGRRRRVTVFAPNAVSTRAGAHSFSVKGLKAGAHTIKVVALVRSPVLTDASGRARTTSLTAKLPFSVC
jgi:hypothetical protein